MSEDKSPTFEPSAIHRLLLALAAQLDRRRERYDLVVIGGSALAVLGLVNRTTKDVDVLGVLSDDRVVPLEVIPESLARARDIVADDFAISREWLNSGPTALVEFGLPPGFVARLESIPFGEYLTVHVAGRIDQIHFKLYAAADGRAPRHEADLRALAPTEAELLQAAIWTRTQDPSEGFHEELIRTLERFGVDVESVEP